MMTLGWTPCSTSTLTASMTVFPVPARAERGRWFRGFGLVDEPVLTCGTVGVTEW